MKVSCFALEKRNFLKRANGFFPNAHLINWALVSSFHINVNLHMFFFIYLDSTLNLTAILKWERNGIKGMHLQNSMPTYIRSIVFFCLCAFEYHAFVWNEKCIFQSGYNLCMGVSRTCVQISAVWWRCCRLFSKFFTFHRRFYSWSMCIWHPENAIKNISTFILIQWVRLLVYSTIWIMPCIFWNGTVSSMSARERMCAYILVMLAHEQTFVGIKMHSNHAVVLIGMRKWNLD